jgi:hypothetical protein
MTNWLDGYEQRPVPGVSGGLWVIDLPDRVVLHTTEGSTIEGAFDTYTKTRDIPHFTVDMGRRRKAQHLPLDVSATALEHPNGQPETNRVGRTIQIEFIGFAQSPDYDDGDYRFLADVLVDIREAGVDFAWTAPEFHAYPPPVRLGTEPWRMDIPTWQQFNGICGHQHVPLNSHGDPGAIDIGKLIRFAIGKQAHGGNEVAILARVEGQPEVWCIGPNGRYHVGNPRSVDLLRFTGVVTGDILTIGAEDIDALHGIPICAQQPG